MRKQELVHLHRLLVEVRGDLTDRDGRPVPPDAFDAYDEFGVGHTSLVAHKCDHETAITLLLDGIDAVLGDGDAAVDAAQTRSDGADGLPAQ